MNKDELKGFDVMLRNLGQPGFKASTLIGEYDYPPKAKRRSDYIQADIAYQFTRIANKIATYQLSPEVLDKIDKMYPTKYKDTPCAGAELKDITESAVSEILLALNDRRITDAIVETEKLEKYLSAHTCKPAPDALELADAVKAILKGTKTPRKEGGCICRICMEHSGPLKSAHDRFKEGA